MSVRIDPTNELFLNLAEQVKLPFQQISYAAELMAESPVDSEKSRQNILLSSQAALRLIDGYLLSVELQRNNQLELEPVSISSLMYDTAEILDNYARAHDCSLELHVSGKYGPVMAHKRAMQAALTSLSLSFIEAASGPKGGKSVVKLAVRRHSNGINTGVFTNSDGLTNNLLKQAKILQGKVRQPISGFDSGNGAGIFIADSLFNQMNTSMKVARLNGLNGLAATLLPSRQLSLV